MEQDIFQTETIDSGWKKRKETFLKLFFNMKKSIQQIYPNQGNKQNPDY